jgi:type IV secretion system protein VirB6
MGVAGWIESKIQEQLDGAWVHLPGMMEGFGLVFGAGVGLYFVMVLLSYMWTGEAAKLPVMDLFKRFFFLVLVCAFSLSAPFYIEYVKEPVIAIPDDVARLISGVSDTSASAVDTMMEKNHEYVGGFWTAIGEMGFTDFDMGVIFEAILVSIVVYFFGTIFVIIAFSYLMVAKILINVVLLIGPAFIMFSFFAPTREYFMKWFGQLLNYIFLVVIFTAVFNLLFNVISVIDPTSLAGDYAVVQSAKALGSIIILLFTYLLFIAVIMAVPSLASSLTGGVGISPFGQVSQLASAISKIPLPKIPLKNLPGIGKG